MSDNSTSVSPSNLPSTSPSNLTAPSNLTSPSPVDYFTRSGGMWFSVVTRFIDLALGIPANGWSLHVIVTSGWRRRSLVETDIITLNLVAMEFCYSLTMIPGMINILFIKNMPMFLWLAFSYGLSISARSLFQCLICLERYLAVVHPVIFLRYKPPRYRLACCGLVWLLALGGAGINFYLMGRWELTSITALVLFIPLLSIDLFCSLSILRVLRQPGLGDGGRERGREEGGGKEEDRGRERGSEKTGGGKEEDQRASAEEGERAVERAGKERLTKEGKNQQKRRAFRIVSFMMAMLVFNLVPLNIEVPLLKAFGPQVFVVDIVPVLTTISQLGSWVFALLHLHRAGKLPCLTQVRRVR